MVPLSLTLFGDIKLKAAPAVEIPLPRKTQILLAYLASSPEKKFTRSILASLIWADRSEGQARQSFRQCLFTLAKSIGVDIPSIVNVDRQYVSMKPNAVEVDIWSFERLLAIDTPDSLQQAVALYVDDFANNVRFDSGTIDTWCAGERTRLRDLCFETLVNLSSHYADTSRLDEAIKTSRRLVTLDPLREDGHRTLIRLYSRAGRRAEAIKQYRECLTVLRAELNVNPEAATMTLYSDIMKTGDEAKSDFETTDTLPDQLLDTTKSIPATADWKQKWRWWSGGS